MEARLQHLLAINRAIAESLDYEDLLELVVEKTAQITSAAACALILSDESGLTHIAASRGIAPEKARAFAAPLDERINGALRELFAYQEADTFLGVPVIHGGQVTGILVVHRSGPEADDPDEELILSALADQAAIALDHASRYHQLWRESMRAQNALELAARRKDEFLAMLAHELRNPLAAIVNAIAAMRALPRGDPRSTRVHEAADRQTMHMKRLLDDLLDASRITQDKIALASRPVTLQEVVHQALQGSQALIAERRHMLEMALPAEPVVVEGDTDRLVQVVANLVTNAAKYTDPGGRIDLTLQADQGQAVLRVKDNGIGIPDDLLDSVFDLFVQARRAAGRAEGGLGIGLSLVRRLVEMHGGTVEVHSEGRGRGSEFVVRLPLAAEGHAVSSRPLASPAVAPRQILLVEDNVDVADLLAEALHNLGHQVRIARDGEAALDEVARKRPQVVLVDIGLPGMDGYELARRVREGADGRPPLLVAITGYGSAQDRQRAREAGFDHHLVKPVQLEQLTRVLAAQD